MKDNEIQLFNFKACFNVNLINKYFFFLILNIPIVMQAKKSNIFKFAQIIRFDDVIYIYI